MIIMSETEQLRIGAFVTLLTAGILIALGGLMGPFMFGATGWNGAMPMGDMMGGYGPSTRAGAAWWMSGAGLVTGALVIVAAFQVRHRRNATAWSVVAIVAGAASLLAMGGFVVGALAAIVGGALGLIETREPNPRPRNA